MKIRLIEPSSLVAPRVLLSSGADRVPITDVLEGILCRPSRQSVFLTGVDCSYAISYLRHFYVNDPRIQFASSSIANEVNESCCVLVHTEQTIRPQHTLCVAPWDRDDIIHYMLSTDAAACASIINRIKLDCYALLQGGYAFWKCIVEAMLESPNEEDFLQILVTVLRGRLPSIPSMLGLDKVTWLADQLLMAGGNDRLFLLSDDPIFKSLLSFAPLRLNIEADRFAAQVICHNKSLLQRLHSKERLIAVSQRLRCNKQVADFLKGCVYESYASTSASILSQIDKRWKPSKHNDYPFQSAYLSAADWNGVSLEEAKFGAANLSSICLDNSVLTNSVFHFAKCDGASFADASMRGVIAHEASFFAAKFPRVEMCEAKWHDCNFSQANFEEACLNESVFIRCDLSDASFRTCTGNLLSLSDCKLAGADFSEAQMSRSHLEGLDLREAVLHRTNFSNTNLFRVVLESLNINHCNFSDANLSEGLLSGTRMLETNLFRANLVNAKLGEVEWENCDLREANLSGATFHFGSTRCGIVGSPYPSHGTRTGFYTDDREDLYFKTPELVRKASLIGCDLRGANLHGVDFYLVDLRDAILDPNQRQLVAASGAILD